MSGNAWVTLATNDSYALGTLVLASSLRAVNTAHQLVVMVTRGVSQEMKERLRAAFDVLFEVNILDSEDEANLALLSRPELGLTFTKLHCWRLTQFQKCVFLDADTMVVQNCDELFEREELSAAPDAGWPDCFNSGVFVYRPSMDTYKALLSFAVTHGSFDGGDQGLLNLFFSDWATKDIAFHLPFIYNMCSNAVYSYIPAYKKYGESVKIVHFIGPNKPWLMHFDIETGSVHPPAGFHHVLPLLQKWWDIFFSSVQSTLSPAMMGLAGAFAQLRLGAPRSEAQKALEEHLRRQNWEQGQADYMGADSFDNVWNKICQTLSAAPGKLNRIKPTEVVSLRKTEDVAKETESKVAVAAVQSTEAFTSQIPEPVSSTVSLQEKQSGLKASDQVVEVAQPVAPIPAGTFVSAVVFPDENASTPLAPTSTGAEAVTAVSASPVVDILMATPPSVLVPSVPATPPSPQATTAPVSLPATPQVTTAPVSHPQSPQVTTAPVSHPQSPQATTAPVSPPVTPQVTTAPVSYPQSPQVTIAPVSHPQSPQVTTAPVSPPAAPKATTGPVSPPVAPKVTTALVSPPQSPQVTTDPISPQVTTAPVSPPAAALPVTQSPPPVPISQASATTSPSSTTVTLPSGPPSPTSTLAAATAASKAAAPVVSASSAPDPRTSMVTSPSLACSGSDVSSGAKSTSPELPGTEAAVPVPPKRRGPHKATSSKDTSKSATSQSAKASKPSPKGKK